VKVGDLVRLSTPHRIAKNTTYGIFSEWDQTIPKDKNRIGFFTAEEFGVVLEEERRVLYSNLGGSEVHWHIVKVATGKIVGWMNSKFLEVVE
jgi:hypothetical protein